MRTRLFVAAGSLAALGFAGLAQAQIVFEAEPNDTFPTAQVLPAGDFPGGELIDGAIGPGGGDTTTHGIDFFAFPVAQSGYRVLISLFDSTPASADSMVGLFNPSGVLIATATSAGTVSLDSGPLTTTGTYRVAVTGAGDAGFNGTGHQSQFTYAMLLGVNVPAPATAALLSLGGLVGLRRRRR